MGGIETDSGRIVRKLEDDSFLVRVPLVEGKTRVVRVNLTFEAGRLEAIDAEAKRRGLTRTAFLASATRKEIEATA